MSLVKDQDDGISLNNGFREKGTPTMASIDRIKIKFINEKFRKVTLMQRRSLHGDTQIRLCKELLETQEPHTVILPK